MTRLRDVQYHVTTYASDANGGPGAQKLELDPDALNITWQRALNVPGQAALTLTRYNPKLADILYMQDHLKIWRETTSGTKCVFAGKIIKPSKAARDAIVYAWSYEAFLQRSRTAFRTMYQNVNIGTGVVSPEWLLAKNAATSPLAFVTTGTIQDPVDITSIVAIKTNDQFGVNEFDRLTTFFTLAEMAMANTPNKVVFEITHTTPHTFNFWQNRSLQRTAWVLTYPGNLIDYDHDTGHDLIVADLATVILDPTTGAQVEYQVEDATTIATYRRLQAAVAIKTLYGLQNGTATESDQQKAAMARMLAQAITIPKLLTAFPRQGEIDLFVGWDLADTFFVRIQDSSRTTVDIGSYMSLLGVSVSNSPAAGEVVTLYLR